MVMAEARKLCVDWHHGTLASRYRSDAPRSTIPQGTSGSYSGIIRERGAGGGEVDFELDALSLVAESWLRHLKQPGFLSELMQRDMPEPVNRALFLCNYERRSSAIREEAAAQWQSKRRHWPTLRVDGRLYPHLDVEACKKRV